MILLLECGDSFKRACANLAPYLDSDGKEIVTQFNGGIDQLNICVKRGDIPCQSNLFAYLGIPGLRRLASMLPSPLSEIINDLANRDVNVVNQLNGLRPGDADLANTIVCNILVLKANAIVKGILETYKPPEIGPVPSAPLTRAR